MNVLNPRSNLSKLDRSQQEPEQLAPGSAPAGARGRIGPRDLLLNLPLLFGTLIVLGLFLIVLFGPIWAPSNPYIGGQHIVPHYDFAKDEFISPPLPPSDEFPLGTDRWGNDLLSLLMHGARNTLIACSFITMVRITLGLILGGIAGWNEGGASDQLIMGSIGVITSVPTLISSMVLIFALDIRRGLPVFIIALSVIGWAEIAQYIRSEFMVLRKMPYIEGAQATGLTGLGIAVRHIVPNILPQLLVITFLEMGAVMMLLGELGFVGVYIGGGTTFAREIDPFTVEILTVVEVPEWGAMLAEGFRWLRSKPFVVFPPALAFFLAVVGFNSLGEGLRRLIEGASINTSFLLKKRMVLVFAALIMATFFILNNTGAAPWFAKVAGAYRGGAAYEHVQALAEMEGRGVGQKGASEAADYIAQKFEEYGLKPGGKKGSYSFALETRLAQPTEQPLLTMIDVEGQTIHEFRHQLEFGFMIKGHGGSGETQAPLSLILFPSGAREPSWEAYKGLDLRGRIVVLIYGSTPVDFPTEALVRGAEGILWITGDGQDDVRSQIQWANPDQDYLRRPQIPIFRIRPSVGRVLLKPAGIDLIESEDHIQVTFANGKEPDLSDVAWYRLDVDTEVKMSLSLKPLENSDVPCVLGFKEGSDFELTSELVVLYANYDGLGTDPDGTEFAAVNRNASGVSILLELARLWQDQSLDPRRSVLFVAWGGGQLDEPGIQAYLENGSNYRHLPDLRSPDPLAPVLLIHLDSVGVGGDSLYVHPDSQERFLELLADAASDLEIEITSEESDQHPYNQVANPGLPWAYMSWSESDLAPDLDNLDRIEAEKLQSIGEILTFALTKVVRETEY